MNSGQKEVGRRRAGQNQNQRRVDNTGVAPAVKNQAKSNPGVAMKSYDATPPTSVGYGTTRVRKREIKENTPPTAQVSAQGRAVATTNATATDVGREYIRVKVAPDRIMIVLILLLVCIGSVVVFSASYPYALSQGLDSYYYVRRQIVFVALGLFVMAVIMRLPYTLIKRCAPIVYGVAFLLLIVVLFIGVSEGAAQLDIHKRHRHYNPTVRDNESGACYDACLVYRQAGGRHTKRCAYKAQAYLRRHRAGRFHNCRMCSCPA